MFTNRVSFVDFSNCWYTWEPTCVEFSILVFHIGVIIFSMKLMYSHCWFWEVYWMTKMMMLVLYDFYYLYYWPHVPVYIYLHSCCHIIDWLLQILKENTLWPGGVYLAPSGPDADSIAHISVTSKICMCNFQFAYLKYCKFW